MENKKIVEIKSLIEMKKDPMLVVDENEIYSKSAGPDQTFDIESMGDLLGKKISVEEDEDEYDLYHTDDGYSIYTWMIK